MFHKQNNFHSVSQAITEIFKSLTEQKEENLQESENEEDPPQAVIIWQKQQYTMTDPAVLLNKQVDKKGPRHPLKNCLRSSIRLAIAKKFVQGKKASEQTDVHKDQAWACFLACTPIGGAINGVWPKLFNYAWFIMECKGYDKRYTRGKRSLSPTPKKDKRTKLQLSEELEALRKQVVELKGEPAVSSMEEDGRKQANKITNYQKPPVDKGLTNKAPSASTAPAAAVVIKKKLRKNTQEPLLLLLTMNQSHQKKIQKV